VTIQSPLYFSSNSSLHYTLDGGVPTEASPKYVDPFTVTESAKVRAAYINLLGVVEGKATATAYVAQPSGPRVENITSPSSTTVALTFSEPVLKSTASIAANYTVSPANKVVSVVLAPDGQSTVLNLEKDLPSDRQSTVTITRVRSSLPSRLLLSGSTNLPIPQASVVFDDDAVQTFDNSTPPYSKNVPGLPTAATASWTINLYAYFDSTPGELTTLAGFGDDQDNTGTQRYILKYENGIHFWASNVDVTTGVPYDTGKWQMVTATFDGTTLRLYKNAKLINSAAITLNDVDPIVKIGPMGPWDNASKLDGKIAGVRIWNSALSADQIAALMSAMPSS
jgi:alpha-mannosidase